MNSRRRGRLEREAVRDPSWRNVMRFVVDGVHGGRIDPQHVQWAMAFGSYAAQEAAEELGVDDLDLGEVVSGLVKAERALGVRTPGLLAARQSIQGGLSYLGMRRGWTLQGTGTTDDPGWGVWTNYETEEGYALVHRFRDEHGGSFDNLMLKIGYDAAGWRWLREQAKVKDPVALATLLFLRRSSWEEYCWTLADERREEDVKIVWGWHEVEREIIAALLGVSGREKPWLEASSNWAARATPGMRRAIYGKSFGVALSSALWWLERGAHFALRPVNIRSFDTVDAWIGPFGGIARSFLIGDEVTMAVRSASEISFFRGGAGPGYDGASVIRCWSDRAGREHAFARSWSDEHEFLRWACSRRIGLAGRELATYDVDGRLTELGTIKVRGA